MFESKRPNEYTDSSEEEESSTTEEDYQLEFVKRINKDDYDNEEIHPLAPTWAFWLWIGGRSTQWEQCLEKQCEITTIEDFCALKCRILPPSRLPSSPKRNYYVFKSGIKPGWDDVHNHGGGAIQIHIQHQNQHTRLDRYWFELLMAGFGGQFSEHNDKICGFGCFNGPKGHTISIWVNVSTVKMYSPIMEIVEGKIGTTNISFNKHPQPQPLQYGHGRPGTSSGANAIENEEE